MSGRNGVKFEDTHPDKVLSVISGGSGWFGTNDVEHYHYHAPADALAKRVNFGPLARVIIPTVEQDPTDELIAAMQGVLQSNDLDAWAPVAIGLYNIINLPSNRRFDTRVPAHGIAGEHDPERRNP